MIEIAPSILAANVLNVYSAKRACLSNNCNVITLGSQVTGNMLAKAIVYCSKNETAGLILGAAAPIVLTSRADSARAKLLSIAAAVALADFQG